MSNSMQFDFSNFDWSDDDSNPFDFSNESSESSCDTCLPSLDNKRSPTVQFAQEDDQVMEHLHLKDYTQEEIDSCWVSREEFLAMNDRVEEELFYMEWEGNVEESRGLEFRTYEGSLKRSQHKREAYTAVLQEQQRQWATGQQDPDRIAAAYLIVSCKCLGKALVQGIRDREEIQPCVSQQSTPKETIPPPIAFFFDDGMMPPCKPYEMECSARTSARRLAVLEDIKILSVSSELNNLWHANHPAAA